MPGNREEKLILHSNDAPSRIPRSEAPNREILLDCILMTLVWIAVYLALKPLQNAPFQDDWIYAWRVRWLLEHGQLRTLEFSSNPNYVQVLWGALFCLPFGFSFTALRVSTGVLAVAATWGQYLLLRELQVTRRDAWIGTAVLAFNPIFFLLAFTFMTEAPFLCLMIWACYTAARSIRTENTRLLIISIALSYLSLGIRIVGIVLPIALSVTLFLHSGGWGRSRFRYLYPVLGPIMLAGVLSVFYEGKMERGFSITNWLVLWKTLPISAAYAGVCLGIWALPLSLSLVRKRYLLLAAGFFVPLAAGIAAMRMYWVRHGDFPTKSWPFAEGSFWALQELGVTEYGVPGYNQPTILSDAALWGLSLLGVASVSILLAILSRRPENRAEAWLVWLLSGQFFLVALAWLIFDRYILTLAPLAIALALSGRVILRPALAAVLVGVLAIVSLVGTRDHLAYNAATWQAIDELRRMGARDSEINAGWVANHWMQFTHADGIKRAPWRKREHEQAFRYEVSNIWTPGTRVLKTIPYRRWFSPSGSIYLLERP